MRHVVVFLFNCDCDIATTLAVCIDTSIYFNCDSCRCCTDDRTTPHGCVLLISKIGVGLDGDGLREVFIEISVPPLGGNIWMYIWLSTERGRISADLTPPRGVKYESWGWGNHVLFKIFNVSSGVYKLHVRERVRDSAAWVYVVIYEVRDQLIVPLPSIGALAKWNSVEVYGRIDERGFSPVIYEISPRVIVVRPGEEFDLKINFTINSLLTSRLGQYGKNYSWTPTWPPPRGYYTPLYDGIPPYDGRNIARTIRVKAPETPGEYYIWVGVNHHYSMDLAISTAREKPPLPAHVKVIVRGASESPTSSPTTSVESIAQPVTIPPSSHVWSVCVELLLASIVLNIVLIALLLRRRRGRSVGEETIVRTPTERRGLEVEIIKD